MAVKKYTINDYVREGIGNANKTGNKIATNQFINLMNKGTTTKTPVSVNSVSSQSSSNKGSTTTKKPASTSAANVNNNSYQQALAQLYAQQQAQAQALQEQQRQAAQAAYNSGMRRLNDAWNTKSGSLRDNLNSTLSNLSRQYDSSKNEVTTDAGKSLREAYINHMLNRKNLNQNLTARGVGGGAAESTMANMYNTYGNSRNDINNTLNDNLTSLENMYQSNVANAQQQYNSAYADAMAQYMNAQNQMEQNLANRIIGSYDSMISSLGNLDTNYANALSKLLANQQSYEYAPTVNTLAIDNANVNQKTDAGTITDYAKYQNMVKNMYQNGASDDDVAVYLDRLGINPVDSLNLINNRNSFIPYR